MAEGTRSYRLLAELEHAFDDLLDAVAALVDTWQASALPAWRFGDGQASADWLRHALLDVWYQDGQDGRATSSHIGIVAADEATLAQAARVNQYKDVFAGIIANIRRDSPSLIPEIKAILPFRHPQLHTHLAGTGLARLHLKQCWRALPVAEAPVARVRMAWYASGRSITRLSVQEAEQRLLALDSNAPHIRIQLKRLAGIPSSEPLARVQTQAPLMRANLFYTEPLDDGRQRRAMNVALPLLLPSVSGRLPDHNQPPLTPPSQRLRAKRRDERLEQTAFLPSLRIYRYRSL